MTLFDEAKRYLDLGEPFLALWKRYRSETERPTIPPSSPDIERQRELLGAMRAQLDKSWFAMRLLKDYFEVPLDEHVRVVAGKIALDRRKADPEAYLLATFEHNLEAMVKLYGEIRDKLESSRHDELTTTEPRSESSTPSSSEKNSSEVMTTVASAEQVRLPKAVLKAYQSYLDAERSSANASGKPRKTDSEIYAYLTVHGCSIDDYELPDFGTWTRYLRQARRFFDTRKNNPRHGREHGRSIVRTTAK